MTEKFEYGFRLVLSGITNLFLYVWEMLPFWIGFACAVVIVVLATIMVFLALAFLLDILRMALTKFFK